MRNWKFKNDESGDGDEIPKIITIEKGNNDTNPQGNKIYFYSEVTRDSVLNLNRQIDELTKQIKIIQFTYNLSEPPPIKIYICSDGGDVLASLSSVDKISNNEVPIHTIIEGTAASSATLLSVCGHKRFITKNSCMLLHQVSSQLWGNYADFQQEVKNLDLIMDTIKNIYLEKSKFKESELNDLLKHDLYMNSTQCIKRGLVDKIL